MKIKIKQPFDNLKEGTELESINGLFTYVNKVEDRSENLEYTSESSISFNEDYVKQNPEYFEIVPTEISLEDFKSEFVMKTQEEIQERLNSLYEDIELLKALDSSVDLEKYIFTMENMAYILEWTLGLR